jgi:PAS domain S-box-containing protein
MDIKKEQLLGRSLFEVFPNINPITIEKYNEIAISGQSAHFEVFSHVVNGKYLDVYAFSPEKGKLAVIFRDITERKKMEGALEIACDSLEDKVKERTSELEKTYNSLIESEEKYRHIVETTYEGILAIDAELRITYVNKRMMEMLGYCQEELIGRPWCDFFDEEGKAVAKLNMKKRRQGINETHEFRLMRKDGSHFWALVSSKALLDKDDKFAGSLSMHYDITERKKAEEALEKIDKMRIKEIHHRIKNNLQVISSMLDLQSEIFEDKKVKEAFKEGQDRVISMALIHEELYKGDGIDTDTLDFSVYLQKLAKSLFQTYSLSNKNISLCTDLEENAFLDMDTAVPLGIIVNELISNSLKHAFPGRDKGEIQIELRRVESEDCKSTSFVLNISDDGIGIPKDLEIEDLDSFGMQLVTILVDQLDGELELKRNNGTEFIIGFSVTENKNSAFEAAPQLIE